jgi:hypothetical protein
MTPDKVSVDRCNWYKADRYYPEQKLVQVAGRFPIDRPLEHAEGSGWFEIAPLGRTWYEVFWKGERLEIQSSVQRFVPQEGTLYTELDFGPLQARVTTFLHATRSLLIEQYTFSQEVELRAWMAPGVWMADGWDTDPFEAVEFSDTEASYDLGETHGRYYLQLEPGPVTPLSGELQRGLAARGANFTKIFCILDNRQGEYDEGAFGQAAAPGYADLRREHLLFWSSYFAHSRITIPDAQFQAFYEDSLYHFKAAQNRTSGGLPVNNLRRTWSSHVFWDSYFIQRALLEADHRPEALEACRFLQRTQEAARRHASEEFGCSGLKWDWEITHDGRKAYGTLLHMKFQAHNNASYANELWQYYQFTHDRAFLAEFLPILEGLATFFMEGIVEHTPRGWEIGPLVGVNEKPVKVKNEGISLAGTIVILEHFAQAAIILEKETAFSRRCLEVANGLRRTLDLLYNGEYFVSHEGADRNINTSSTAPIYPMRIIPFKDPRAMLTAKAVLAHNRQRTGQSGQHYNFPWASGVLATIFARQGDGEQAWSILQDTRPTICQFGGMAEVMEGREWNMQYFGTAQAAVVTALHSLLLQGDEGQVSLFPALPAEWQECSFENLLAEGLEISATYRRGQVSGMARNIAPQTVHCSVSWKNHQADLVLKPGETYVIEWNQ